MTDPEDADYVCTLTPQSLEKASRELFEDPKQRLGAVQTLRKWIKEQPHMVCRTDTGFLLQILRTAKFSQLRAREHIVKILTMKTKRPKFMSNFDSHDEGILAFIDRGIFVPLPKPDAEGRHIFIMRPGQIDTSDKRLNPENEFRTALTLDFLLKEFNENVIVNGEVLVIDMTGFSMKHMTRMSPDTQRDVNKIYQECLVGRMKGCHMYNGGAFFEAIMSIARPFIKKKFMERIFTHSTMESLYQSIPMELWPDEYLPDDYKGPSVGPIGVIMGNIKTKLLDPEFRARLLDRTSDRYKIDLKAKPDDTPQASFRKLSVD